MGYSQPGFHTHRECANFRDGLCTLYGVNVDPNGAACTNFMPKNMTATPQMGRAHSGRRWPSPSYPPQVTYGCLPYGVPPTPQYSYPPYGYPPAPPMFPQTELEELEAYKKWLEAERGNLIRELKEVEARIKELKNLTEAAP